MRATHQRDPLHRIECWTGKYFRPAALWEVGVYILIKHHNGEVADCTLKFQETFPGDMQLRKDNDDQEECLNLRQGTVVEESWSNQYDKRNHSMNTGETVDDEAASDFRIFVEMDRLHAARQDNAPCTLQNSYEDMDLSTFLQDNEDDNDDNNHSPENEESSPGFDEYCSYPGEAAAECSATSNLNPTNLDLPNVPTGDALNNQYLRIAHINGIHHLAAVTCSCQGEHKIPIDLMHSGFMPTTFHRIRTVFTFKLLDMFRLSNLELKASAYQYFQLLHRLTVKAATPAPNLYHDLRKVSRAWRWMKKLKWAGFGHKAADPMSPAAGELTVFCPACPQPNINLPADWKHDANK
jgi:CxC2 like cysteine cluster associated with KDZ transposases